MAFYRSCRCDDWHGLKLLSRLSLFALAIQLFEVACYSQDFKPGDKIVCLEKVDITDEGAKAGSTWPGLVLVVEKTDDDKVRVTYKHSGWIPVTSVAPLKMDAIDRMTDLISSEPEGSSALDNLYNSRGNIWRHLKNYRMAIEDFNQAIELNDNWPAYYNNRGLCRKALKEFDEAIVDFGIALEHDSNYALAYNNRGATWIAKEEFEKAVQDYSEAIRIDPKYVYAHYGRANSYWSLHQYENALNDTETSLRLNNSTFHSYNLAAWIHATCPDPQFRDGKKAIKFATKACELTSWKDCYTNGTLAASYAEAGEFEKAVEQQTKAIGLMNSQRESTPEFEKTLGEFKERLELYKKKQPYRTEKDKE